MRIAIVGTGIAGNVVAHRLCAEHDITVFEANDYVGGHTNTITVPSAEGDLELDTGFIVFNDRTYPNFVRLLDELGVRAEDSSMSFSVRCEQSGLEYNGATLNALFAQRGNLFRPAFHRMLRDILRFNREAPRLLDGGDAGLALGDYLAAERYSQEFIDQYLVPMGAAIWSAEPGMMRRMPASFFVRFFLNHGLLSIKDRPVWRVIKNGSRRYVEKLTAGFRDRIRLGSPVRSITRLPSRVVIKADGSAPESFDCVFLACHSDEALRMLANPLPIELDVLGAIPYQRNEAILHTDSSLMPRRRLAWAAWNYHIPATQNPRAAVTYHLNRLQGLDTRTQYFVSLNSEEEIREDKIIRRIAYAHPVFHAGSVAAQARQEALNGRARTYYCGAYWRNGFHEDGVVSSLAALEHFAAGQEHAQLDLQRTG